MTGSKTLARLEQELSQARDMFMVALGDDGDGAKVESSLQWMAGRYANAVRKYREAMFEEGCRDIFRKG